MSGAPNYYSRNPDPRANYDQAPLNDLGKLENHFSDDEVKLLKHRRHSADGSDDDDSFTHNNTYEWL